MKILYVGMKYDYGNPEWGLSFEHCNFFDFFHKAGYDILYFDFLSLLKKHGKAAMNARLLEVVRTEKPDVLFSVLFTDEFLPETLREISEYSSTITLNWFCDDHWRFDNFTKDWAKCFNFSVTTAASSLPKYAEIGYENVIKSQWAANHFWYRPLDIPKQYDVSFVGQPHGNRGEIIRLLQQSGFSVFTAGRGWAGGRVSQEEMITIFNQSRINLNLSNASVSGQNFWQKQWKSIRKRLPLSAQIATISVSGQNQQIKGRNFEVPACGAFLLTGEAENIEEYYAENTDFAVFRSMSDLVEKVGFFLKHAEKCENIAHNGLKRTLAEHTYAHRFEEIFQKIGIKPIPADEILRRGEKPGIVEEITI